MNILISSLGVGRKSESGYQKASYKYNDKIITSKFISKALVEFLNIDKLFLVGTSGSIWDAVYEEFGGNNEDIWSELGSKVLGENDKEIALSDLEVVNKQIDKKLKTNGSKCFLIDYGMNEVELWSNFSKYIEILNFIEEGDIVYLDITHSFRSLALMSFVMVEFGNLVKDKDFKVAGIFYGMFEATKDNNGNTPIVDLKILYDLMQWIKAINSFKKYGNAYGISELLDGREVNKEVKKTFNRFSEIFSIGYISSLRDFINSSSSKIKMLEDSNDPIIKLISKDIIVFFNRFNKLESLSLFQYELASWYFENKNYGLSYSALLESIISYECEIRKLNPTDKNDRELGKNSIKKDTHGELNNWYHTIRKVRNNSAHLIVGRESYKSDIDNLAGYLKKIKLYFKGAS